MCETRISSLLWKITVLFVICCCLPAQAEYGGGTGEPNDPYLISTPAQMNTIGIDPCDWDKHFKLMADIDLSGYTGTSFNIIAPDVNDAEDGFQGITFIGVFDGNGHTISNFTYYTPTWKDYMGLFGYVDGPSAEIKALGLISPDVDTGWGWKVGSLVGRNLGTISNCYVDGGSVSGSTYVGRLVGENWYSGVVVNCYTTGSVSGTQMVGGLVGRNFGRITNSYSAGSVSGGLNSTGGLVASNSGTITYCYSTASVSSSGLNSGSTGGLAGWSVGHISNSYATGRVSNVYGHSGGLVGRNAGAGGTITNCYSTGNATGTMLVGGLVGSQSGTISASFWDKQSSELSNMCGGGSGIGCDDGNGKTTAEMQTESTFTSAGWDFVGEKANGTEYIWRLCQDLCNYPQLAREFMLGDFVCSEGVDFFDYSFFASHWLEYNCGASNDCGGTDLDRLGSVGNNDLGIFVGNWLAGPPPGPASNPNPTDGALGVSRTADLSWTAGRSATSHDVYFGTINPPSFIGNQSLTTYDPGTMAYSTTYYWRIDEVNPWGTTTGTAWSFTTMSSPPPM
jgi:hypothetical protein